MLVWNIRRTICLVVPPAYERWKLLSIDSRDAIIIDAFRGEPLPTVLGDFSYSVVCRGFFFSRIDLYPTECDVPSNARLVDVQE